MLRKRGDVWYFQVQIKGKKWTQSTGETDLRRARRIERRLLKEALLRRGMPHGLPSFDQAVEREIARIRADVSQQGATRAMYCFRSFQKWLGKDIKLEKITTHMLEQYQRDRLNQASLHTVSREISSIIGLLRENGIAVIKPRSKPGRVTEQREFTDDELTRFFAQPLKEEHRVLFRFLLATGARPAEVIPSIRSTHVALLKSEILPEKNIVLIRNAKVKIGQKVKIRKICIPADLMEDVVKLATKNPGQHVFHRNSNLHTLFDRICKKAGIPKIDELGRKVTAHSFRHTYGTKMSEAVDGNQFVLKQTLGHSRISTTDRYVHALATNQIIDIAELKQNGSLTTIGNGSGGEKRSR